MKFTEKEQVLIDRVQRAEAFVPSDWDLEIDYLYEPGEELRGEGWYAMRYLSGFGAVVLTEYSNKPIITEEEAERLGIDVEDCLNRYGCYVVGP